MKSRLIDVAAFVVGTIPAFMLGGLTGDIPWPIRLALSLASPGYVVGLPLCYLVGAIGLFSLGFFFLVAVLANGLIFGLASYLIRNALKGQRLARLALVLGMGTWITWSVVWAVNALRSEPPFADPDTSRPAPASVDLASPLAGRWDGMLHAPSGDRPVTLVYHPRTNGTLEGYFYSGGAELGRLWDGGWSGDSLHFRLERIPYRAHFDRTTMALEWSIEGNSRSMELRFVGADTSRPARPQPNRFMGQLPH